MKEDKSALSWPLAGHEVTAFVGVALRRGIIDILGGFVLLEVYTCGRSNNYLATCSNDLPTTDFSSKFKSWSTLHTT